MLQTFIWKNKVSYTGNRLGNDDVQSSYDTEILYLCNLAWRIQRSQNGRSHTAAPPPLHDINTPLWLDGTPLTMSQLGYTDT